MNKTALITGGSRGIGKGIALELAQLGHDLLINFASNSKAAKETASECARLAQEDGKTIRAEIFQADISIKEDRDRLVAAVRELFGKLDLLVNNAGVAPAARADLLEADEASFDRLMAVNVKGPYFLTQQAAKWMVDLVKAGTVKAPKIITISSVSAYTASINRGDYCISKAALSMLTPLYAARLAEFGILVYEIRPGIIASDMTAPVKEKYDELIQNGLTPIPRWGAPEDVGKAVAAIAQDLFPFSTGEVLNVDGGFHLRLL
jgi:3-oxoacyl-[acyl-carrier protein] reductase